MTTKPLASPTPPVETTGHRLLEASFNYPFPRGFLWGLCCLLIGCGPDSVPGIKHTEINSPSIIPKSSASKIDGSPGKSVDFQDGGLVKKHTGIRLIPSLPKAPPIPLEPSPLDVPKYSRASHVGPDNHHSWPKPIVVVLHGNFDRPEWECDYWHEAGGFYGWTLCPRGIRTPWASKKEDRWTYRGKVAADREIEAALKALEERYPGRVTREGMVLAGFSLGGILAPGLVEMAPGKYDYMFLVEGGLKKLNKKRIKSLSRLGLKGIGFAMSAPGRRRMAKDAMKWVEKAGMKTVFVDMKGAGHGYRDDFPVTGQIGLRQLLGESNPVSRINE